MNGIASTSNSKAWTGPALGGRTRRTVPTTGSTGGSPYPSPRRDWSTVRRRRRGPDVV